MPGTVNFYNANCAVETKDWQSSRTMIVNATRYSINYGATLRFARLGKKKAAKHTTHNANSVGPVAAGDGTLRKHNIAQP